MVGVNCDTVIVRSAAISATPAKIQTLKVSGILYNVVMIIILRQTKRERRAVEERK